MVWINENRRSNLECGHDGCESREFVVFRQDGDLIAECTECGAENLLGGRA